MHSPVRPLRAVLAALVTALLALSIVVPAQAAQNRVASGPPIPDTARIIGGYVYGIDRSGDTVVVVGDFGTARDFDGGSDLNRVNILSFDLSTGDVSRSFVPQVDDVVHAVHITDEGDKVLIAGEFKNVNGVRQRGIARLNLADGSLDTTWRGQTSAAVYDMAVTDDEVIIGGIFEWAGNIRRPLLAALDLDRGLGIPAFDFTLSGILTPNSTNRARQKTTVLELDVSDDGRWLAVLGNHTQINGLDREQVGMIDLGSYSVADWHAPRFAEWPCYSGSAVNALTYIKHVDFAPGGDYLVTGASLAWGGGANNDALCDAVARFEAPNAGAAGTGTNIEPSWVTYAGIDSIYRMEVTEAAVYVGGHYRWLNTPYLDDGAVARLGGLAAVDPLTGVPLSWQPDDTEVRPIRGYEEMLADGDLLLLGRDGNVVGDLLRQRVAAFDTSGGPRNPLPETKTLPAQLYVKTTDDVVRRATFDGSGFGSVQAVSGSGVDGVDWGYADDGFLQHGQLVTFGQSSSSYFRRSFAEGAVGPVTNLSTSIDYVDWGRGGTEPNNQPPWVDETVAAAYLDGRIIYRRASDDNELFWRHFSIESGIIGGEEFPLELGENFWDDARALTVIDDRLYAAWSDGNLYSWDLTSTIQSLSIDTGSLQLVDDGSAGIDWASAETMFAALPDDTAAPSTSISSPAGGAVLGSDVTLSGSASDNRRVDAVDVTVRNTDTGQYLQPDGSLANTATTLSPVLTDTAAGQVDWRLDVVLPDGAYRVTAVAVDGDGNTDPSPAARSFTVSTAPPDSTIDTPATGAVIAPGIVTVSGGATAGSGVASVGVTVRNRDTRDWLQPDGSFAAGFARVDADLADPGASTTGWSLDVSLPEGDWAVTAKAVGSDGGAEDDTPFSRFMTEAVVADGVEPDTAVTTPPVDSSVGTGTVTIAGTATDDSSGVARVDVALRDVDSGQWLREDGSFGSFDWLPATVADVGATSTSWTIDVTVAQARRVGVVSRAIDAADNAESDRPFHRFQIVAAVDDDVEPDSAIDQPAVRSVVASPVTIAGTATDDSSGVDEVLVTVRSRTTLDWLQPDGSLAAGFALVPADVADPGATATTWTLDVTLPPDDYATTSRAVDRGGNTESDRPFVPFTVQ